MYAIRVMTYNIDRWSGHDDAVTKVIGRAAPDIVALQGMEDRGGSDPAAVLADRLAMRCYRAGSADRQAFLSYYPLRRVRSIIFPGGTCLRADACVAGRFLHLFNLQLTEAATCLASLLPRLLAEDDKERHAAGCPMLFLGDFADRCVGFARRALSHHLRPVRRPLWPATYPARWPLWARDRAYLGGQLTVVDARIYRDAAARRAASHLPLLLTVRVADPRSYLDVKGLKHQRMEIAPG
jgi:endonuclease/exonuclease/phosphatase family metal-dependent hydrolase